jgi:hypothetical protein
MKEDTVTAYHLDVAFKSDVTANDQTLPIAMAYGFTAPNAQGAFVGLGQTKETPQANDTVEFWVYDMASPPTTITSVQISIVNKTQGANAAMSPFSDEVWKNVSSVTAVSNPSSSQAQLSGPNPSASSTGLNIKDCTSWGITPFTIASLQGQQRFEITITVLTQTGQPPKSFIVDPEVVVEGSNK